MMPKQCQQGQKDPRCTAWAALAIALTMAHPAQAFTSTGYVPPPANQQMGVDDQVTIVMWSMCCLVAVNSTQHTLPCSLHTTELFVWGLLPNRCSHPNGHKEEHLSRMPNHASGSCDSILWIKTIMTNRSRQGHCAGTRPRCPCRVGFCWLRPEAVLLPVLGVVNTLMAEVSCIQHAHVHISSDCALDLSLRLWGPLGPVRSCTTQG